MFSDKSEDFQYVKQSFNNARFVNSWEEANVIWKPTPSGINVKTLPRLEYLNNLLSYDNSWLKVGLKVYGDNFFDIIPYSIEYTGGVLPEIINEGVWLTKPVFGFSGQGIKLYNGRGAIPNKPSIIQKYIENPLLIDGRKFDIRMFVLTSDNVKMYPDGFARIASLPFVARDFNVNRHVPSEIVSIDDVGIDRQTIYDFINNLQPLFQDILDTERRMEKTVNTFELFGIDIIFDEMRKPWLMEISKNPDDLDYVKDLIPDVIKDVIYGENTKFFELKAPQKPEAQVQLLPETSSWRFAGQPVGIVVFSLKDSGIKALFQYLAPQSILEPSANSGDKMLAAAESGVPLYHAIGTNPNLMQTLNYINNPNYFVLPQDFMNVNLDGNQYDMILTDSQTLIDKAWSSLKVNGFLVLSSQNTPQGNFSGNFLGTIPIVDTNLNQLNLLWIWQK